MRALDRPAAAGAGGACCCKAVGRTMEGSKGVCADREQWGKGYVQVYLCTEGATASCMGWPRGSVIGLLPALAGRDNSRWQAGVMHEGKVCCTQASSRLAS